MRKCIISTGLYEKFDKNKEVNCIISLFGHLPLILKKRIAKSLIKNVNLRIRFKILSNSILITGILDKKNAEYIVKNYRGIREISENHSSILK